MIKHILATGLAVSALATPAVAGPKLNAEFGSMPATANGSAVGGARSISGSLNGVAWTASNAIVGLTSTATIAGGGNPIFQPDRPRLNGVVSLIMNYGAGGSFICTGSLLPDGKSIVTAAHCVSDGYGTKGPLTTTAYFYGGPNGDAIPSADPAAVGISVSRIYVNSGYTGEVIDQNDIAILRLSQAAPSWATRYELSDLTDLTGAGFNVAGFGRRSDTGGSVGANLGAGRLRQGDNIYDYRWGDAAFGGFFTDRDANGENYFGTAEVAYSYLSDFDNGLAANDMSCLIAGAVGAPAGFGCDLGVGAREVGVAGGDSGGPQFVNGKIASVTSYGLSFGTGYGDCVAGLNSSCGEYSGYVPIFLHRDFIAGAVPEPATWAMMIAGFGLVGISLRRRRTPAVTA